jgi:tetratricopeptide (TPR) repeat protein
VSSPQSEPKQEIDPAFRQRCESIYQAWYNGDGDFRVAVEQLLVLQNEAISAEQYAHQGLVENSIGMMYGYRADLDQSIRHFSRARDLFERARNPAEVVRAVMNLGESYRLKGDFARARQFFRMAYEQAGVLNVVSTQAYAASNEGHLLLSMHQYESARERFERALELAPQIEDKHGQVELRTDANQGMAAYYLQQGDNTSAWKCALESMRLSQQAGQPFLLGFAFRTMGDVLTALGRTPSGTPEPQPESPDPAATNEHLGDPDMYFQLAVEKFQEINAEGELARTIYAQGMSLLQRGQKMTASRKFYQAMLLFTKLGMKDDANKAAQAQMQAQAR